MTLSEFLQKTALNNQDVLLTMGNYEISINGAPVKTAIATSMITQPDLKNDVSQSFQNFPYIGHINIIWKPETKS